MGGHGGVWGHRGMGGGIEEYWGQRGMGGAYSVPPIPPG